MADHETYATITFLTPDSFEDYFTKTDAAVRNG
jgi:hypothetical protein